MELCDKYARLKVRTNADTPRNAQDARGFGAVGIGLCRTEHMFFDDEKIVAMREMILAKDVEGRKKALDKLLPYQKADFKEIFKTMDGLPVNVRLLDPPLHERTARFERSGRNGTGHGCNRRLYPPACGKSVRTQPDAGSPWFAVLGNTYPEITEMQTRAIHGCCVVN